MKKKVKKQLAELAAEIPLYVVRLAAPINLNDGTGDRTANFKVPDHLSALKKAYAKGGIDAALKERDRRLWKARHFAETYPDLKSKLIDDGRVYYNVNVPVKDENEKPDQEIIQKLKEEELRKHLPE